MAICVIPTAQASLCGNGERGVMVWLSEWSSSVRKPCGHRGTETVGLTHTHNKTSELRLPMFTRAKWS